MDPRTIALTNFVLQIALFGLVGYSGYLARFKRDLGKHCWMMRIAVIILIVSTALIMAPSFSRYAGAGLVFSTFLLEVFAHALLGVAVVGIWVYVSLCMAGVIKMKRRLLAPMRVATGLWAISFVVGVHIYLVIWA